MQKESVVVIDGVRTPIGRFGGSLTSLSARELGIIVTKEVLRRSNLKPEQIDEVIFGNARQAGNGPVLARQIAFFSGIPADVPAYTINKACSSSLKAIELAAQSIMLGDCDIVIAGGVESMSNIPYLLTKARWGYRLGDGEIIDVQYKDGVFCPLANMLMGQTAENLVEKYNLTREQLDEFACESQHKTEKAIKEGRFKDEIIPVKVILKKGHKKETIIVDTDEHPRFGMTMEKLAKLKPLYKEDGVVTAGNTCGINDAGAAVLLTSATKAKELGLNPMARIVSYASGAVDPYYMGLGPVPATKKALKKANMAINDMNLIECNEAFASQMIACGKELKWDWNIVNVNGGGIALGHPVGATGARLFITLLYEMKKRNARYGLATLCVSGGQGDAVIVERI